nr:sialidase family protein [uncultured Brevundimonas sp.]
MTARARGRKWPCRPFPEKPEDAEDDPHPWTLGRIWNFTPGGVPGRIYAGTMPGGLFRSDDRGETWSLVEELWLHPGRKQWFGVAGGEQPGLSSVLVDPRDPAHVTVGVSTGGVWATRDEGETWSVINKGMINDYMPPDQQGDSIPQDIHQLAQCPAAPDVMWCQHHSAIFRSVDAGENWVKVDAAEPSGLRFCRGRPSDGPGNRLVRAGGKRRATYPGGR